MIPTTASYPPAAKRCSSQHRVSKSLLILPIMMCALTCVSCTEDAASPLVDVTPLGDGLRVLAYAILGVGVLGVLGKLVK
jgi:hypothetical protein